MGWINFYGLFFVVLLLIPNVIFAVKHRDGFENLYENKFTETAEQIGRFGSFIFMIFCPPFLRRGWWFDGAQTAFLVVGSVLAALYILGWIVFRKTDSVAKSLVLSIVPSLLFLCCGVLTLNIPLLVCAVVFAPSHIVISFKNAVMKSKNAEEAKLQQ